MQANSQQVISPSDGARRGKALASKKLLFGLFNLGGFGGMTPYKMFEF
jgi:hypothetical protein